MTDGMADSPSCVGVVVVNYGSHSLIRANLWPNTQMPGDVRVVVVDNFTSVKEAAAASELCDRPGWHFVANSSNLGYGAAMNKGIQRARALGCKIFVLLNPDARIALSDVKLLADRVVECPMRMVSPTVMRPDGSLWFSGGTVLVGQGTTSTKPGSDSGAPNGWLTGACLVMHDYLWAKVGGFDESFFLYWEDVDLSWRCVASGGELSVADDVYVTHSVGGTQSSLGKSPQYVFYNCRNRLLFARKHFRSQGRSRWAMTSVTYARAVTLRGGRRNFLRDPIRLSFAAVRGTISGLVSLLASDRA